MSDKTKIIIFANGQKPRKSFVHRELDLNSRIIAADGGIRHCLNLQLYPHYIIGDFDSGSQFQIALFPEAQVISKPSQYLTDMEKALELAESLNPDQIIIFSAVGKRIDHSTTNLLFFGNSVFSDRISIYDRFGILKILSSGHYEFRFKPGQIVSLFSVLPVNGLTLTGFEYPLNHEDFSPFFVGVSNITRSKSVSIEIGQGTVFMYERILGD